MQAVKLLEKALELDPKFPEAYFELGKVYFDDQRYQQAIAAFERAVALQPTFPQAYYRLGGAYAKVGDRERAQKAWELSSKQQKAVKEYVAEREKEILRFVYTLK